MKNKGSNKPHQKQKSTPVEKKKSPLWIVILIIVVAGAGGVIWQMYRAEKSSNNATASSVSSNAPSKTDQNLLVGRWTRTDSDGAYVIEIKTAGTAGTLEANYFNPNPIKVGHAEWQQKNGKLIVIVELRDVNYPGSTYTLNFVPSENRMTGNYYQAVQGQNFEVEFVRAR
jgi:cytoskeletal protein RodZ